MQPRRTVLLSLILLAIIQLAFHLAALAKPLSCVFYPTERQLRLEVVAADLVEKIKASELRSGGLRKKMLICEVTIKPDGSIFEPVLLKSSGSERDDREALDIIKQAAPFAPHPKGIGNTTFVIHFLDRVLPYAVSPLNDFQVTANDNGPSQVESKPIIPKVDEADPFSSQHK